VSIRSNGRQRNNSVIAAANPFDAIERYVDGRNETPIRSDLESFERRQHGFGLSFNRTEV